MDRDSITRTGARAPGAGGLIRLHGGAGKRSILDTVRGKCWLPIGTKGDGKPAGWEGLHRKSGLEAVLGKTRTGENPPYGILGGTMETSASFEARSAPSSYPTPDERAENRNGPGGWEGSGGVGV
jgi:hypothetical protein